MRITHLPSGVVVNCRDERSQHKNKSKAMRILRSRLFDQTSESRLGTSVTRLVENSWDLGIARNGFGPIIFLRTA